MNVIFTMLLLARLSHVVGNVISQIETCTKAYDRLIVSRGQERLEQIPYRLDVFLSAFEAARHAKYECDLATCVLEGNWLEDCLRDRDAKPRRAGDPFTYTERYLACLDESLIST